MPPRYRTEANWLTASRGFNRQAGNAIQTMAVSGIAQALRAAGDETTRQTKFLAEALARRGTIPATLRREAHQKIGEAAHEAVMTAYKNRRYNAHTPPYRANDFQHERNRRYAGGILESALANPNFFDASANGIKMVNERYLDATAKQWRRLNFGAGGAAGAGPRSYPIKWDGLAVAALKLDGRRSAAFSLPPGMFLNQEFIPAGELSGRDRSAGAFVPTRRRTRGIRAANFLDAGVQEMARQIPIQYGVMYDRVYRNFFWRQDVAKAVGVTMPRPK